MGEDDKVLLDLMQEERETQYQGLRCMDVSLHQLAFAYVAAFALCVPAALELSDTAQVDEFLVAVALFLSCTLIYVGGFYALMLVRSRNNMSAHIAFLSEQINGLISKIKSVCEAVGVRFEYFQEYGATRLVFYRPSSQCQ